MRVATAVSVQRIVLVVWVILLIRFLRGTAQRKPNTLGHSRERPDVAQALHATHAVPCE